MRILLVEDDTLLGNGVCAGLRREDNAIDWVKNGETALSAIIETQYDEAENQVKLQVLDLYYELEAVEKAIIAAQQETLSATKSFEIINKKYNEGQASLIQFIDARTTMTSAEFNSIIATYDYKIKYAEFERAACLYDIAE